MIKTSSMAENPKNDFDVLGIPHGASKEDVRKAYKRLALRFHPDKGGSNEAFQQVLSSYQRLSGMSTHVPIILTPSFTSFSTPMTVELQTVDDLVDSLDGFNMGDALINDF